MSVVSKKRPIKLLYTLPSIIVACMLVFVVGKATFGALQKMLDSREKRKLAEKELLYVENRFETLQEKVSYLETEKGVEEAVRDKYNVAKEGEKVFIVVDSNDNTKTQSNIEEEGIFDKMLDLIYKWLKD